MQLTFLSRPLLAACCGLMLLAFAQSAVAQIADVPEAELIERLKEDDVDRRRDAAYELVRRRTASAEIANAFANSVSDRDNQVRFQALLGLARMGATAEPAIEALIQQLDDRDDQIRYRAADALGKIGPAALPQLLDAWQGDSQRKRSRLPKHSAK